MVRCTFREILTSYMNQIMAQLAGSAGFCLSVHIRRAPALAPVGPDQTGASGECKTVQANSGPHSAGPTFSFTHSAIMCPVAILRKFSVTMGLEHCSRLVGRWKNRAEKSPSPSRILSIKLTEIRTLKKKLTTKYMLI